MAIFHLRTTLPRVRLNLPYLPTASTSQHTTTITQTFNHTPYHHTAKRHKSCGLVGLPNIGKSTLFNSLTKTQLAQASNYPFTTIEPNRAYVAVDDATLHQCARVANSAKIVSSQIEFVDIAGLVKNASTGAGLGNQFLSNIRGVDVVIHMVRCYVNDDIIHVDTTVDPLRDIEVIETELLLSDLQLIEKRLHKAAAKQADTQALLQRCSDILSDGKWLYDFLPSMSDQQRAMLQQMNLITLKPIVYVCNVDDESAEQGNQLSDAVKKHVDDTYNQHSSATSKTKPKPGELVYTPQFRSVIHIAAQLEADAAATFSGDAASRDEYLAENNVRTGGLEKVVQATTTLLRQQCFYTIGPEQAVAWTVSSGATALVAAGKIHSDIADGFVSCELIKPADFIQYGGEDGVRAAGKIQVVGKDYVMCDKDIVHFRFNKKK